MNKRLFGTLAAAVGAAALALAAPGAAYGQANSVSVSPSAVAPGGTVTVKIFCNDSQMQGTATAEFNRNPGAAQAGSPTISVPLTSGEGTGTYKVPGGASPGTVTVIVSCPDNTTAQTTFTVSPNGAPDGGTGLEDHGAALAVAGGSMLAAGATGGVLLLRRRRADARIA